MALAEFGVGRTDRLVPFEELDRALVLFRRGAGRERPEVFALPRFGISFPRIKPVFSRAQLSDHA
jgi:hypothetical protein